MYQRILEELKKQDKSVAWLVRKTGISYSTFAMMNKRGNNLNASNTLKVAQALKISPKNLLGE